MSVTAKHPMLACDRGGVGSCTQTNAETNFGCGTTLIRGSQVSRRESLLSVATWSQCCCVFVNDNYNKT